MAMAKGLIFEVLRLDAAAVFEAGNFGRQIDVIHRRHGAAETFRAEELLGVKSAVGLSKLDVSLIR
jgi:hypothetical protein